jgi:RHS repeat-associated protein
VGLAGDIGTLAAIQCTSGTNANKVFYTHHNHRGDVILVREGTSSVASYDYTPFGATRSQTGSNTNVCRFMFSSKELDKSVGWYYYGYRYYSPEWQRWSNQDPLGESFDNNLYRFCYNDPECYADSDGLWPQWIHNFGNFFKKRRSVDEDDNTAYGSDPTKKKPDDSSKDKPKLRVRHFTSPESLKKIRDNCHIKPSRPADDPGVWFSLPPFPSRFAPQVGEHGRGAYVEFDPPPGWIPKNYPGEGPWGFVPTRGNPLSLDGLHPKYVGLGPLGLW